MSLEKSMWMEGRRIKMAFLPICFHLSLLVIVEKLSSVCGLAGVNCINIFSINVSLCEIGFQMFSWVDLCGINKMGFKHSMVLRQQFFLPFHGYRAERESTIFLRFYNITCYYFPPISPPKERLLYNLT